MNKFNNNIFKIMQALIEKEKKEAYMRELERITKTDIKIISKELSGLVENNILDYEIKGKIKQYFLKKNLNTEFVLTMTETYRALEFLEKNPLLKPILTELHKEADFVIFGSHALKTNIKDSDLDLVIFAKKSQKIRKILGKINKAHAHFITLNEFRKLYKNKNTLAVEVIKNHVLFGNYNEFAKMVLEWNN
ncbi:nucleotidyltransferase domain-containing protein [Candidatus Woesearchaeota archaeon]|nr:nucleotidyltransferase domain-containing protein [Candidatus Woesearchaeota archaeon]